MCSVILRATDQNATPLPINAITGRQPTRPVITIKCAGATQQKNKLTKIAAHPINGHTAIAIACAETLQAGLPPAVAGPAGSTSRCTAP